MSFWTGTICRRACARASQWQNWGVGTGLNLLALALAAETAGATGIRYVGFEAFPLQQAELARALAPFADIAPHVDALLGAWSTEGGAMRIGAGEGRR